MIECDTCKRLLDNHHITECVCGENFCSRHIDKHLETCDDAIDRFASDEEGMDHLSGCGDR